MLTTKLACDACYTMCTVPQRSRRMILCSVEFVMTGTMLEACWFKPGTIQPYTRSFPVRTCTTGNLEHCLAAATWTALLDWFTDYVFRLKSLYMIFLSSSTCHIWKYIPILQVAGWTEILGSLARPIHWTDFRIERPTDSDRNVHG